jgi:2-keto-3-deoxy-L-rhamnonate aldolase RhmA/quercetin dioxygenase-like cupin family protein
MKTSAVQKLRAMLAADEATYGLWVTLESASITEMAVALGMDWVVIDAEHGHLDWSEINQHVRATVRSNTVALVRLAELNGSLVKRALDIGADGVVIPGVETASQLQQAVAFSCYPPDGVRGIGGERATCWGACLPEAVRQANEHVLVVPIIESVAGGRNVRELVRAPNIEFYFLGPADYSATAGFAGEWEGGDVANELLAIQTVVRNAGKQCGIVATGAVDLARRRDQGFRLLGLGLDGAVLQRSLAEMLAGVRRQSEAEPALASKPFDASPPLVAVPAGMLPNRREVINPVGSGNRVALAPGVEFECLVGGHNGAQRLTTGIVTMAARAKLPYHRHSYAEAITLLAGTAVVAVEGRCYRLSARDNIVIPRELAHSVVNTSNEHSAELHVAMASDVPHREADDRFHSQRVMPDLHRGVPGAERLNWWRTARPVEIGMGARFVDYFNDELMPGIEMSGGYGEFAPAGRLPCHIHDFDESICIVQGEATCVVEGNRYTMSGRATALQPRGRCHYFINERQQTMAMLWVYAGPMPQRILMQEPLCFARRDVPVGTGQNINNSHP